MFDYFKTTLKNNLRLVFIPTGSTSLAVKLLVGVGSKNEEEKNRGIAHFLEHMAFKGTKKRPDATELRKEMDKIGALNNASTSKETTSYWIKSTPDKLEFMLDMISDIVFNSLLRQKEIDKEKGVIIEEYNMYQDTPIDKVDDLFEKAIFGDTNLGWEIIGKKEVINGVKRKDFINYQNRFYYPSNMVLAIAGGIKKSDWKRVRTLTDKYFGKYSDRVVKKSKVSFEEKINQTVFESKKVEQTHLVIGLPSFDLADPRRWPLAVLRMILVGNTISRLWIKIREERGWVYYIHSYVDYYQETGVFGVKLGLRSDKVKEAVKLIKDEILNFAKTVTAAEIKDAKSCFNGRFLLSLEDPSGIADVIGETWLLEGKIRTIEENLDLLNKVTLADVRKVAEDLFSKDSFSVVAIGPKGVKV